MSASPDIADEVKRFYERYPYPRPIDSLEGYRRLWSDPARRRVEHHLAWPAAPFREDHAILVAGCGTSQAAKHALRWPSARVVGIDVSETSVRCTEELARRHALGNLEVRQLAIEDVGELGETFDQIVCTGVLHHLADPDRGLAALARVLRPGGAMHLMVYAPYGRTGIYMLQEFCKRLGIAPTDDGIRDLVAALRMLPPGHALASLLREAPDFRHEAALADALLHPHDRAYSVPQLFDLLARQGLTFGRWIRQAPYSARCGAVAHIPQSAALGRLSPSEEFAAVELFRGTMVRHSLIAYRDDHVASISFAGDAWRDYVPLRMSDTLCVREQLPPGAAAVVLNRTHTHRDILLPLDATEVHLYAAIDGTRTLAELAGGPPLERVRRFFEQLWWHDQVVFDASPRT